jgi:hypothetical protein
MSTPTRNYRWLALLLPIFAIGSWAGEPTTAQQKVSVFIVRHAETDLAQPTLPLSPVGRQRAELLTQTLQAIEFTHVFSSHTTRSRQTVDGVAKANHLSTVQLPVPGSQLDGQPVTEQTSRRAPIEPIAEALLKLPAGSVALVGLNSENIFAVLGKLGVPVAEEGKQCERGRACVPCTNNSCFPLMQYDQLWHVVIEPGQAAPIEFVEMRYGQGWKPAASTAP